MLAFASSASAAVSCNLAGGNLAVTVTGTSLQTVGLRLEGGEIAVWDSIGFGAPGAKQTCNATPTPANTNAIAVTDVEPGSTNRTQLRVSLEGGPFVNSDATGEGAGTKEIEITFDGGEESDDDLLLDGAAAPGHDNWRMGELASGHGFQLDDSEVASDVDGDDIVASNVEQLQVAAGLVGNPGNDILDARGGAPFTGPLTLSSGVKQLVGGTGDDHIFAGAGDGWFIEGDEGADQLTGGSGADSLRIAFGTEADVADGNGGDDSCSYANHNAPIEVDLRVTTPQDTGGAGIDTVIECESLVGGAESDLLIGTDGPNALFGGETSAAQTGADTLIGLGGPDTINGSFGSDTASYAQGSTGPITVDLGIPGAQSTGGAGADTIGNTENLVGSEFTDTLTGDGGPNQITAYGDGLADTVICAGGADEAILDELDLEPGDASCETRDNAPQTSIASGPADGAVTNDPTPTYDLGADETASFELRVDGGGFAPCMDPCDVPALTDGAHTLRFRAVDADEHGNPDVTPATRTLTVDTVAPGVQITAGPPVLSNDPTPTWRFEAPDGFAVLECRIDRAQFAPCTGPGASHTAHVVDGPHTLEVRAADAAGNTTAATDAFFVDTRVPDTTANGPRGRTTKARVRIKNLADEGSVRFECKLDKRAYRPCGSLFTKRVKVGKHKFRVRATDAAGNTDPTPAVVRWRRVEP